MSPSLTDAELAGRLQEADTDFTRCRMSHLRDVLGNPYGVEIESFDSATAFVARRLPMVAYFNKVVGLSTRSAERVQDVVSFYGDSPFQIEITPSGLAPLLAEALTRNGFAQTGFHATLFGAPRPLDPKSEVIGDIRKVSSEAELEQYVDVNLEAWGVSPRFRVEVGSVMQVSYAHPNFHHYIAFAPSGEPVSVATVHITERRAYYGNAATIPSHRGMGYQQRLLACISDQAFACGCEHLVGMATFGSTSQRNMERTGMRLGYTQAIWTAL